MDGTDSSSPLPPETTEVLYGLDNIQRRVVEAYSWIQEELDGCVDLVRYLCMLNMKQMEFSSSTQ
jgi:hypothetical protein